MTAAVTSGSFSSHAAILPLNESSLLARLRSAGPCAGALRYLRIVRQPIFRWRSILRMDQRSDQYSRCRSLICSVSSIALFLYAAGSTATPAGCCLQDGGTAARLGGSASITQICAGAELLFARSAAPGPRSQTCAAECFRSRAEVLFARLQRRRFRSRS